MMRRDVFQAIADPNRRAIINMLAHKKLTLGAVSEYFNISRPAISKHVKILEECGLIEIEKQGRERYCKANLKPLNEVMQWVNKYSVFWENKLDNLEQLLEQDKNPEK